VRIPLATLLAASFSTVVHAAAASYVATVRFAPPSTVIKVSLRTAVPLSVADASSGADDRGERHAPSRVESPPAAPIAHDETATQRPPRHARPPSSPPSRIARKNVPTLPAAVTCARDEGSGADDDKNARADRDAQAGNAAAGRGTIGSGGDATGSYAHYGVNPKPSYPVAARQAHEQGTVVLHVLVRSDGTVGAVDVAETSGYGVLDDSAVRTVRDRWRFVPARANGVAIESWVKVPIRFTLDRA
jgi:periplasmic protein TonB